MKICVVTVYNSINCGSYLQAKALQIVLENQGHKVTFLERKNTIDSSSSKLRQFMVICKNILKGKWGRVRRLVIQYSEFQKLNKQFNIEKSMKNLDEYDFFILGSDTIWNIEDRYFLSQSNKFFGGIFSKEKIIAYAPSIGNTPFSVLYDNKNVVNMLNRIDKIGVRDEQTQHAINKIIKRNVDIVCDPTLLLYKEDYLELCNSIICPFDKYIYIYTFEAVSDEMKLVIREFAKKNEMKIIAGTESVNVFDEMILCSPLMFLSLMINADYVITDTFHGTAFAINFEKQVAVINRNKSKVNNLLKSLEAESVIVNDGKELEKRMSNICDYPRITDILEKKRKKSYDFLMKIRGE